jgi:TRAP-type transport system periplasmic protein
MFTIRKTVCIVLAALATAWVSTTSAQEIKHYRFAYDQPKTTGYGIAGALFADKLKELSKGTMLIDQYPGAQLGQEPQVLQLVKAGDVEFCISSSANAATLTPQAGVMSLHFLFRGEDHLVTALADPNVTKAVRDGGRHRARRACNRGDYTWLA